MWQLWTEAQHLRGDHCVPNRKTDMAAARSMKARSSIPGRASTAFVWTCSTLIASRRTLKEAPVWWPVRSAVEAGEEGAGDDGVPADPEHEHPPREEGVSFRTLSIQSLNLLPESPCVFLANSASRRSRRSPMSLMASLRNPSLAWNTRISLKRRSPVVGKAHITCKLGPITLREPNVMPMQPSPGAWNAREVSLDEPVDPLAHRHATD
jgi:hypothetical protein